ncbi:MULTISPECIES: glutaredoxin family protein [Gammaproteobacteria]|uniref:glutaredoxin family protein n=1 Tax=Gammaproteobacteria TaxID=1236 RepID=UPI000DCFAA85|nr:MULTISPECIES: glutaredoxin family protein [Gammaproteobacteria]RTE87220.1 glutaredoxin family protein [Aliidiomarina sp. B3213]TCZ92992.1 glutaredoxin family protein [Lysobacter sp. N42]
MNDFYLLISDNCPLCKLAIQQIHSQELEEPIALHMVDIHSDPELVKEYGALVPVLVREKDDQEMKWPFEPTELKEFLSL